MRKILGSALTLTTLALIGCSSVSGAGSEAAASFPGDKPVTVIVPYDAGGSSDTLVRALEPYIADELGTDVIVENRTGAGGQIGLTELANSGPDGHTIGLTNIPSSLAYLNPDKKATYGGDDFTPLGVVNQFRWILTTSGKSEWANLDDLVAAAKKNPGGISVGTDGLTGDDHMAAVRFQELTGTELKIVPYDSGSEKLTALMGGQIDVSFGTVPTFQAQLATGDVKPLAVLQEEPIDGVDAAPAPGQGVELTWASFNVLSGPADLPEKVVDRLEVAIAGAVEKASADPEFKKRMTQGGFVVEHQDAAGAKAAWDEYEATWEELMPLARQAG